MLETSLFWKLVGLAALDSINPCTMYIYAALLLATSIKHRSPRRVFSVGVAFILAVFMGYLLVGLGIATISYTIPLSVLGVAVIVYGLFLVVGSIVEAYTESFRMPRSGRLLGKLVLPVSGSILASAGLGLLASFTLLPCSSGPLVAFITIARTEGVGIAILVAYLMLYNAIFVAPLVAIAFTITYSVKYRRVQEVLEKHTSLITLASGVLLTVIGLYVLVAY